MIKLHRCHEIDDEEKQVQDHSQNSSSDIDDYYNSDADDYDDTETLTDQSYYCADAELDYESNTESESDLESDNYAESKQTIQPQ